MLECTQTERIVKMEEKLELMVENVDKLATAVSGLVKFETEIKAIEKFKMKKTNNNYKLIGIVIAISGLWLTTVGILITYLTMNQ